MTLPASRRWQESSLNDADELLSDSDGDDTNPTCDYCRNNNVECIKILEGTKYACVPCRHHRRKCSIKDQMINIRREERKVQKKQQRASEPGRTLTTIPVVTLLILNRKTTITGPVCQIQDGKGQGRTNNHDRTSSVHGSRPVHGSRSVHGSRW